jgi:hypothetical protein
LVVTTPRTGLSWVDWRLCLAGAALALNLLQYIQNRRGRGERLRIQTWLHHRQKIPPDLHLLDPNAPAPGRATRPDYFRVRVRYTGPHSLTVNHISVRQDDEKVRMITFMRQPQELRDGQAIDLVVAYTNFVPELLTDIYVETTHGQWHEKIRQPFFDRMRRRR